MKRALAVAVGALFIAVAAKAAPVTGSGCVEKGVEQKCLVLTDIKTKKGYSLHFGAKAPNVGTAIEFKGESGDVDICQQGAVVNVKDWKQIRLPCEKKETKK